MSRFKIFVFIVVWLFYTNTSAQDAIINNPPSCGLNILIPDNNCHPDGTLYQPVVVEINVINNPVGAILGQDVFLSKVHFILPHTWTSDIQLVLESPSGDQVVLVADAGGGEDDFGSLVPMNCSGVVELSMTACTPIKNGVAPFLEEAFLPEESLFDFNGISNPANGVWTLRICDQYPGDVGSLEYVELIFEPMTCLPITDVQLLENGIDSVTVAWDNAQACETVILEYGAPGFVPGVDSMANGGLVTFGACSPQTLHNLVPDTEYELYVRTYCSASGVFSSNSCPLYFRTGCLPPAVTLLTDFDTLNSCSANCMLPCPITGVWENGTADSTDWKVTGGLTPTPGTGPLSDVSGDGKYIYFETSGCIDAEAQLISKCIELHKMGTDTCNMSFFYNMKGLNMGTLKLDVTDDGAQTWQPLWQQQGNQGSGWKKVHVGLGDFPDGSILQFRFVALYGNGSSGDMALDNIAFHGAQLAGTGSIRYYLDQDGDGYGQENIYLEVCSGTPPNGYTFFFGDCNDDEPSINPGMPEIPCDEVDNNCNGGVVDDDAFLPPILNAVGDTVCNTESATISATADPGNTIYWYSQDNLGAIFWIGDIYTYFVSPNNTAFPIIDTFYVGQGRNFTCFSTELTPVYVVTNPTPAISFIDVPNPCAGTVINLAAINFVDNHLTGASLAFYEGLPATSENLVDPPIVTLDFSKTYYYVATSPQGCEEVGNLTIFVKPLPKIEFAPSDSFSICVDAIDTLYASGIETVGPYSFQWSNGSTQSQIAVMGQSTPGDQDLYLVTVTDAVGCESLDSVQIETSNSIDSVRVFVENVSSCNGADGVIQVIPSNGVLPYSYTWEGPNASAGSGENVMDTIKIENLSEGVYDIFILDGTENGCDFRLVDVIVQGPNAVIEAPVIQPVSCNGGSNGSICVNTIGSATYEWNNGAETECITSLEAGNYELTISSGDCQTVISNIIVEEPEAIVVLKEVQNPSCGDIMDGQISVEALGGMPPYQYLWDGGSHNPVLTDVSTGFYGLTITDFLGCQWMDTIEISEPEILEIEEVDFVPISCFGASDGLVHVQGSGGVPPYSYEWNTNTTVPIVQEIAPNTFLTVTVTDANGCEVSKSYQFVEPDSLGIVVLTQHNPICAGDNTGSFSLGAIGGTPPFTFYLDGDLIVGNEVFSLGIGDYWVQVTDSKGCTSASKMVRLSATSGIDVTAAISAPDCVGQESGSIGVSVVGTNPFEYQWAHTLLDTPYVNGLGVGQYDLRIIDGVGCYLDTVFNLSAPQVFNTTFIASDPSCFNVDDGLIDIAFANEGTRPFDYKWSDGSEDENRVMLAPNLYNVTITDALGCRYVSDTLELLYPSLFTLDVIAVEDLVCKGDSSGFIEVEFIGGTLPYDAVTWLGYNWTMTSIADLPEGDYELLVNDFNGCPIDTIFHIGAPEPLVADTAWLGMEFCRSVLEDTLVAVVSGGVEPYHYLWSDGSEAPFLHDVPEDNYNYTVTDANGCTQTIPPVKFEKEVGVIQLDSFYLIDSSCFDGINLSAIVEISNGSGDYTYHFTPTIIQQTDQSRLKVEDLIQSNHYSVTVTDRNSNCQVQSPILPFSLPDPIQIEVDSMRDIACVGAMTGAIFVSVTGGAPEYSYSWKDDSGMVVSTDTLLDQQGIGVYNLDLIDSHGCEAELGNLPLVNGNSVINLDTFFITQVSCKGESTGSIDISISGGRSPYEYTWSYLGGTPGEDLLSVPSGNYSVEIVDANDCRSDFFNFLVNEPDDSLLLAATVLPPSCPGAQDGEIVGQVEGGGAPYLFEWTKEGAVLMNENDPILSAIESAAYTMIVRDTFGCVKNLPVLLEDPDSLMLQFDFSTPVLPEENGFIEVQVSGGTAPYSYQWSTQDTTARIENLGEGIFEVMVTDSLGCSVMETIELVKVNDLFGAGGLVRSFNYYPNPVNNIFTAEIDLIERSWIEIDILDIFGHQLLSKSNKLSGKGVFSFDMDDLPSGTYIVRVRIDHSMVGGFFIVRL